jgi:dihydroflavonol-4-reductase
VKVLLTGGTGFVGSWTARAVVDAGHQVRYLVRDPARLEPVAKALDLDVSDHVVGDITDRDAVRTALRDCDGVVHCAAVVAIGPGAAETMSRTNLEGARNVLGQAVELGLDPILYVSSLAAVFRPGLQRLTADLPVLGGLDDYGRSKGEVEEYVRGLQADGAPIATTYPGMVIGPPVGTQIGEGTEGMLKALRLHVVPGIDAAWTVCDVRDLASVHAALLRPGRGPSRWAAGGVQVRAKEIARLLRRASGRRLVHVPVPDGLLRAFGKVSDRLHLPGPMTAAAMEYWTRMPDSDNEPVRRELGVEFRDPYVTFSDSVAGLRAAGKL